jgi:aminopeptidase N
MRFLFAFSIIIIFTARVEAQKTISGGPLKPEQAAMDIKHYTISLDVNPAAREIKGFVQADFVLNATLPVLIFDLVQEMNIATITVNGRKETFNHENQLVKITGKKEFVPGTYSIKFEYSGKPAIAKRPPWEGGFQWEKDSLGNPWIAISCQGEGGKIYFPCKDHPSDEPDYGADMIISVPKGLVVAGPGLLKKKSDKGSKSVYHWKTEYPISNYCLLFNVGKYKVISRDYKTIDNHTVPMQFYVLEEHVSKAEHHLELLENSARVLEKYFGEYPWVKEKIAIAETPHLGMEHQTMNAYGNKFKYTQVGGKDFDWLMHHEFGHEWWANKVTNTDWAHMWIQEGICAFGDALYTREAEGEQAYITRMQRTGRAAQNKLPIVQGEEGLDANKVYHGDIYGKGAFFIHTLRYMLGDEVFFPTILKLATDPAFTYLNTVTTNDLDTLFSKAYGQNLTPVFNLFLRTTDKLEFSLRQTDNDSWTLRTLNLAMPVPVEVVTGDGTTRLMVDAKGVKIQSASMPRIDPQMYYLKKVVIED